MELTAAWLSQVLLFLAFFFSILSNCSVRGQESSTHPWNAWTSCSAKCGLGFRTRTRDCGENCLVYDHEQCQGRRHESCKCSSCECKNDRRFATYCRLTVARDRKRWCNAGSTVRVCRQTCRECDECTKCPPVYERWSSWNSCSLTCGGGVRYRFRDCKLAGGCKGAYWDSEFCNQQECEVVERTLTEDQCRQEDVCSERFEIRASSVFQAIRSPGFPNSYPSHLTCEWLITAQAENKIELLFTNIDIDVCIDSLLVYDPPSAMEYTAFSHYSAFFINSTSYFSRLNSVRIAFSSTSRCSNRTGFQLLYREQDGSTIKSTGDTALGACGYNARTSETPSAITSPLLPQQYGDFQYCEWNLEARSGYQVVLDMDWLETEKCCDSLEIYDGDELIRDLRGLQLNIPTIRSASGHLKLVFTSDSSITDAGFFGEYYDVSDDSADSVDEANSDTTCDCGYNLELADEVVTLSSPNWPEYYCHNAVCEWNIYADDDTVIHFNFTDFSLEACCDSLEILEPNGSKQVVRGYDGAQQLYSSGNRVRVRFQSDESVSFIGFNAFLSAKPVVPGIDGQIILDNSCDEGRGTVSPQSHFLFNPLQDARDLQMAMDPKAGGGIIYDAMYPILSSRSLDQRLQIADAYEEIYSGMTIYSVIKRHFVDEMRGLMLALFTADLQHETNRVRKAIKEPSRITASHNNNFSCILATEGLVQIILCRSSEDLIEINQIYRRSNNPSFTNILSDAFNERCEDFKSLLTKLVENKLSSEPEEPVNEFEALADAEALQRAAEELLFGWTARESNFFSVITKNKNTNQLKLVFQRYKELFDTDITEVINELSGNVHDVLFSLVEAVRCKSAYLARVLHQALTKEGGIDASVLTGVIVTRSEIDMVEVKKKYNQMYGNSLEEDIQRNVRGAYRDLLIKLIEDRRTLS